MYFAELQNNIVKRVIVANTIDSCPVTTGTWIETAPSLVSKNNPVAGKVYYEGTGTYSMPQPYPSWTLDDNFLWQPPTQRPKCEQCDWDEINQKWIIIK